jgi:hypothetical protein
VDQNNEACCSPDRCCVAPRPLRSIDGDLLQRAWSMMFETVLVHTCRRTQGVIGYLALPQHYRWLGQGQRADAASFPSPPSSAVLRFRADNQTSHMPIESAAPMKSGTFCSELFERSRLFEKSRLFDKLGLFETFTDVHWAALLHVARQRGNIPALDPRPSLTVPKYVLPGRAQ